MRRILNITGAQRTTRSWPTSFAKILRDRSISRMDNVALSIHRSTFHIEISSLSLSLSMRSNFNHVPCNCIWRRWRWRWRAEAKTRRSAMISQLGVREASAELARHRYNIRTDASCPGSAGNQTRCLSFSHPFHQLTVNLA